ncbi:hypothetical protein [Paraflavitalea speifideaquila]|uniref:hypothetical protein n=1 Tax=Paraflavitalea speifideaquila TaxID=3076558 RepID=UPI0028F142CE|nr:hypothetical protein [Paraflavitalea speifideiaquila]
MQEINYRELVLGTKSRSGQQFDIWEAVYSPVGADGYPKPIWNKRTGVIDSTVAAYWKEHYDLSYIMKRDWAKIGNKLKVRSISIAAIWTISTSTMPYTLQKPC